MIQSAINKTLGFAAGVGAIKANKPNDEALVKLTQQVDELKAQMANSMAKQVVSSKRNIKNKSFRGKATLDIKQMRVVGGGKK